MAVESWASLPDISWGCSKVFWGFTIPLGKGVIQRVHELLMFPKRLLQLIRILSKQGVQKEGLSVVCGNERTLTYLFIKPTQGIWFCLNTLNTSSKSSLYHAFCTRRTAFQEPIIGPNYADATANNPMIFAHFVGYRNGDISIEPCRLVPSLSLQVSTHRLLHSHSLQAF